MIIKESLIRFIPYIPYRLRLALNVHIQAQVHGMVVPVGPFGELENVFWKPSWKTEMIKRYFTPEGAFVDVGVNLGQTLIDFKSQFRSAKYIGFEPNIECFHYLKRLIEANSFGSCHIIPIALGNRIGIEKLWKLNHVQADASATIMDWRKPGSQFVDGFVPCFSFDQIRSQIVEGRISVVKIDVEGAELEVLTGMKETIKEFRPTILCEVLFCDGSGDMEKHRVRNEHLMNLLNELQYKVFQLIKSQDNCRVIEQKPITQFPWAYWTMENREFCDYIFVSKDAPY